MRFQDHPTWRMLEQGKRDYSILVAELEMILSPHHPVFSLTQQNIRKLIQLQLKVEEKLCQDM